jgi:sugar (pentulose or hexulose) kinase
MTGGAVSWMARVLGHDSLGDALAALPDALDAPPTAGPPFFYPSLSGSRFPDWRAADRGSFVGLSAFDGAGTLLRATAEGAAFVLRRGLSVLASAGLRIDELIVVGGLANHSGPLQLRADILGLPLRVAANAEASSIGAAMTAGIDGGSFADAGEAAAAMVRYADVVRPNPHHARTYDEKFARWSASFCLRD